MAVRRRQKQLELALREKDPRGGRRVGAGRPRKDGQRGKFVTHLARPTFPARFPLHVTLRMARGVWNLRSRRCFRLLERAFYAGSNRFSFRVVHYSVQGNHIHLLVEAPGKDGLAQAMKGLGVRIAKSLNRLMRRRGRVIGDRYHARILRTPSEVRNVRHYLRTNAKKHYALTIPDQFTSQEPFITPRTWLMRNLS